MSKVSVIIPIYQVEAYIAQTIQSVLNQTYSDFELLLVNDGSTDRSLEQCQSFTDSRIRILHQPNRGVSAARNHGIRAAQGEYLAFLDGDDLWHPDKLARHVEHLDQNPRLGLSFSHSAFIDETGKPLGLYQQGQINQITPALILCRNPIGNGSTPVIRRATLQDIEFLDEVFGVETPCYFDERLHHIEDVECWLRIALQTHWQIAGLPEPLTLYRVTSSGASANLQRQASSMDRVLEKTAHYSPSLIQDWGNLAKAYQLRFLARRAVRLKAATIAITLAHQSLRTAPRILTTEPRRTLLTLAAAYSLWLLPAPLYQSLESLALTLTGLAQKRRSQIPASHPLTNSPSFNAASNPLSP